MKKIRNIETEKNQTVAKKKDYWETVDEKKELSQYPHLGEVSFKNFLIKIVLGLMFSFLPAIIFSIMTNSDFIRVWGVSILLVSGFYFVAGGWRDLSRTSARKSHKKYMERTKITQEPSSGFRFNLNILQFGTFQEDVGAAICLLGIGAIIMSLL